MMVMLFNRIWKDEYAPRRWREGEGVFFFFMKIRVVRGSMEG